MRYILIVAEGLEKLRAMNNEKNANPPCAILQRIFLISLVSNTQITIPFCFIQNSKQFTRLTCIQEVGRIKFPNAIIYEAFALFSSV